MIGIGFDIHRLIKGRRLFLGGVAIKYPKGLLGHSDGDVLLHAICDALLGAAGLGDLGKFFPDTKPEFRGIASSALLERVLAKIRRNGFRVVTIDTIIIAEEPKLIRWKESIRKRITGILGLKPRRVNIKAKTMEGLGVIGAKQAIAAFALAYLNKKR